MVVLLVISSGGRVGGWVVVVLLISSGGRVADGVSDTVLRVDKVPEEEIVEWRSLGGGADVGVLLDVVEGCSLGGVDDVGVLMIVVGCNVGGGHFAARLRFGLVNGREIVWMIPFLAEMSFPSFLLPLRTMSPPSIDTAIEHLFHEYLYQCQLCQPQ